MRFKPSSAPCRALFPPLVLCSHAALTSGPASFFVFSCILCYWVFRPHVGAPVNGLCGCLDSNVSTLSAVELAPADPVSASLWKHFGLCENQEWEELLREMCGEYRGPAACDHLLEYFQEMLVPFCEHLVSFFSFSVCPTSAFLSVFLPLLLSVAGMMCLIPNGTALGSTTSPLLLAGRSEVFNHAVHSIPMVELVQLVQVFFTAEVCSFLSFVVSGFC